MQTEQVEINFNRRMVVGDLLSTKEEIGRAHV